MESKWLVIRGSLYEKIAYFAKFMTSLLWYLELDKVVSKALRRISKNMPSFQEELLYVHKDSGGMGFTRLSTLVQLRKLSLMQRVAGAGGAFGHAMSDMLARPSNYGDLPGVPGQWRQLPVPTVKEGGDTWWATSLLQWLARLEIGIVLNGCEDCLIGDETIVEAAYKLGLEENDYIEVSKDRGLLTRGEWLSKDMGCADGSGDALYLGRPRTTAL
jgi:hypothetical protein